MKFISLFAGIGGFDLGLERAGKRHWQTEPAVCRVANGVPFQVDRLRGLGNAVVPQVAEFIGRNILTATGAESRPN